MVHIQCPNIDRLAEIKKNKEPNGLPLVGRNSSIVTNWRYQPPLSPLPQKQNHTQIKPHAEHAKRKENRTNIDRGKVSRWRTIHPDMMCLTKAVKQEEKV